MRTIRMAVLLGLVAVPPAFAQEAAPAGPMESTTTVPARAIERAWHSPRPVAPRLVIVEAPARPGRRARLRGAFRQMARESAAEYARSREPRARPGMADEVAVGAVVGGVLGMMATANGCGADFHECPIGKFVVAGAGAGALVAIIAHKHKKD